MSRCEGIQSSPSVHSGDGVSNLEARRDLISPAMAVPPLSWVTRIKQQINKLRLSLPLWLIYCSKTFISMDDLQRG